MLAIVQEVRFVSKERSRNLGLVADPIKMGLKRVFQAHKLVAGAGFEPATFRL